MEKTDDYTKKIKSKMNLSQAFSQQPTVEKGNYATTAMLPDVHEYRQTDIQTNRYTDPQINRVFVQDFLEPATASHNNIGSLLSNQHPPVAQASLNPQTKPNQNYSVSHAKFKKKMTFNISEECFNRFHKMHATRLYQGRGIEKGDLIAECIDLLYEQEKRNGHITN